MAGTGVSHLVAVGASAGGIDALSTLVATLPDGFPAPIVIAQHLDPRRRSHLPEILARKSALPVRSVEGREKLEAGVIYLVPANADVEITDHEVGLTELQSSGPRPSVDRLLRTAAESFGEQLIAVILSGEGSDGAEGARAVKQAGGTVVIQDPRTAAHPSMPLSLAPPTVDIISRLEAIGPLLNDLLTGTYQPMPTDDEASLERFLKGLRDQTGIDFASYKRPTITRRLERRMAAVGVTSLRDYQRYLGRNPDEYDRLASSFLIKVTDFFRDADLYDYLRERVVPDMIRYASEHEQEIRIWSAGCATGEEAYSLAMLLADTLGEDASRFNVRVFATDLDSDAIAFARRGIYPPSSVEAVPADLVDRYFQKVDDAYEIRKQIRTLTVFGQHDLAQRAPFPRIDLAVTRNVLIYFTAELQKRALQLFAFSLREGGRLVLGKAESVSQVPEYFVVEEPRLKVFRRQGDRVLIPPSRGGEWMREGGGLVPARSQPARSPFGGLAAETRLSRDARPTVAEKSEQVLLRLPIGVVLVNAGYDIQLINGAARRMLDIHGTAIDHDFVHVATTLQSQPLRSGIDGAMRGQSSSATFETDDMSGRGPRILRLSFEGHRVDTSGPDIDSVIVVIEDTTSSAASIRTLEEAVEARDAGLTRSERRLESLARTNEELMTANEDLTLANAELRSGNEELLVGTEEVQAATEEVETLNEELQATNEELETLNEELQATVEELNTTNDDLEARSAELEESAAVGEDERRRAEEGFVALANRLEGADGILLVDRSSKVKVLEDFAAAVEEGRVAPVGDSPAIAGADGLLARAARGEQVVGMYEIADGSRRPRLFEFRSEPLTNGLASARCGIVTVRRARARRGTDAKSG